MKEKVLKDHCAPFLIMPSFRFAWIPIGAWLPLFLMSQFRWAYMHHSYQDLEFRILLAILLGLVFGTAYAACGFALLTKVVKPACSRTTLVKAFTFAHLPLYLVWLQPPLLAWHETAILPQYAPYLGVAWGLGWVGFLARCLDFSQIHAIRQRLVRFWGARQCFVMLETILLLALPGFILLSLKKYLPFWLWVIPIIIGIGLAWGRQCYRLSLWKWLNYGLFGLTGTAACLATWNIYHLGSLFMYPDTGVYLVFSKVSLWSKDFWLWNPRPILTSLIFKLFQQDMAAVNVFYIVIYLAGAAIFILALSQLLQTLPAKLLLGYGLLLLFLNQHDMSLWLSCALTEVPSIVTTLGIITMFAVCFRYRAMLSQRPLVMYCALVMVVISAILFATARDVNAYFLPCLALFYWGVLPRWREKLMLAACLLAIFIGLSATFKYYGRWGFPMGQVMQQRILPNNQLRRYFQQYYHFPKDEQVMSCAKLYFQQPCQGKETLKAWIEAYGLASYQDFLLKHPVYVLTEWLNAWDAYQQNLWILDFVPEYYADAKVRAKTLNAFIFSFPGAISLQMAGLLCLWGLLWLRKNPVIIFCLLHSCLVGILAFHGDSAEVPRHYQQPAMTLKIAFLLCLVHLYQIITSHFSNNNSV